MTSRIVFIDSAVAGYPALIPQLPADAEVVVLNSTQDGIAQMLAALQGKPAFDAIDIISHGAPGTLMLGAGVLNDENLTRYAAQLEEIGKHLNGNGDILLYGCDVAQGSQGQSFIEQLAQLTGADVAASDDKTGHHQLEGNWLLEQTTGSIETTAIQSDNYLLLPMSGTGLADIPQSLPGYLVNWMQKVGAYFATIVYGDTSLAAGLPKGTNINSKAGDFQDSGFDDNYIGFVHDKSPLLLGDQWEVLSSSSLPLGVIDDTHAQFTGFGLFHSYISTPLHNDQFHTVDGIDYGNSNALVVKNHDTLVLAFRGTDSEDEAVWAGQAFTGDGAYLHYEAFRPLIEAVYNYLQSNSSIKNIVVSGHSMGGMAADIFTAVDAHRFAELPDDKNLLILSMASPGIDKDLFLDSFDSESFKNVYDPTVFYDESLIAPGNDYYYGLTHHNDRVYWGDILGIGSLEFGLTPVNTLLTNDNFSASVFYLANIKNDDVDYNNAPGFQWKQTENGFGAHHNELIYWKNIEAYTTSVFEPLVSTHSVTFGVGDYPDPANFRWYEGPSINDQGVSFALNGNDSGNFILGLEGSDELFGNGGDDLLDGGKDSDFLKGGTGADFLFGGSGIDFLYGEGGSDTFVFDPIAITDSASGYRDRIYDFNQGNNPGVYDSAEQDKIDISAIVGNAFAAGEPVESLWKIEKLPDSAGNVSQLFVDPDGQNTASSWTPIANLDNIPSGDNGILVKVDPNGSATPTTQPTSSKPGSYFISPFSRTIDEDTGTISFTIKRPDDRSNETVYVSTTVNRGSANNGDYEPWLNVPVSFFAGDDTETVEIEIDDDASGELPETFGLIVQSSPDQPAGQYLSSASFTIIDDDSSGSSGAFTTGNDTVWITPAGGSQSFDGLAGNDTAVLDLRAWSGGISTSSSTPWIFSSGGNSLSFYNVESFFVIAGAGNDNLVTGNGIDGLFGGSGNDTLTGGESADILDGGNGDDYFGSVGFGDTVAGGSGTDTVNFDLSGQTADMTINLNTGEGAGGSWTGIEMISGSLGSGNDNVIANMLLASIYGNGGNDSLTLDYSGTLADGRTATGLNFGNLLSNGYPEYVYLSDGSRSDIYIDYFEKFNITGTPGGDYIPGGNAGNTLYGRDGNDYLIGGAGADILDGGNGDDYFGSVGFGDTVAGGAGTDMVNFDLSGQTADMTINLNTGEGAGGSWTGIEIISGSLGSGNDNVIANMQLASIYDYGGNDSITLDYSGTLADGRTATGLNFGNLLSNGYPEYVYLSDGSRSDIYIDYFEKFNITGTPGGDYIPGGNAGNTLYGRDGNDSLIGGAGADILDGGNGDDYFGSVGFGDTVAGGAGTDTVNFDLSGQTADMTINLNTGEGAGGSWTGVEFIQGALGTGDDTVKAGIQLGSINGNSGIDSLTLDYSGVLADGRTVTGISFSRLQNNSGYPEYVYLSDGSYSEVYIYNFEKFNITATPGNDYILGGNAGNTLYGRDGNDYLIGGAGADILDGGNGDDYFGSVGFGDTVAGGAGTDTVNFDLSGQTADMTINLNIGEGAGGSWTGVEMTSGSLGSGNDNVIANMQLANISGNSGDDSVTLDYSGTLADGRTATALNFGSLQNPSRVEYVFLSDGSSVGININYFEKFNITGTPGADYIPGSNAGNTLYGRDGNDYLIGGAGADILDGGNGDDYFGSVGFGDTVAGGSGTDTVNFDLSGQTADMMINLNTGEGAGGSWTGVEMTSGSLGSGNDNVIANMQLANISGNSGDDSVTLDYSGTLADGRTATALNFGSLQNPSRVEYVFLSDGSSVGININYFEKFNITGTPGADYILGGNAGNTLYGRDGNDQLTGGAGVDILDGGKGNDILTGNQGNDTLNGGTGVDTMTGGLGNDAFIVNDTNDVVTEYFNEGIDKVSSSATYVLSANVENLTLTGTKAINGTGNDLANKLVGNAAANQLTGGAGNDTLDGKGGADTLAGGLGNDSYVVDNAADVVTENLNEGTDKVSSSVAYTLPLHVENLTLTGASVINGTGNDLDNVITGNGAANQLNGGAGNDTLNGGAGDDTLIGWSGADIMKGGLGNDSYLVENTGDIVAEKLNEGTDHVNSRIAYTLPTNVENLTLTGAAAIDGAGNGLANVITGNNAANQLNGGAGNDTLDGAKGINTLTGGAGKDIFKFTTSGHSDTITDFIVADDTIQLGNAVFTSLTTTGTLAAGQFLIGTGALDADDFVIYNNTTGALFYDADGGGAGAAIQIAALGAGLALTHADIVVI